jgi:hypothetical protein
LLAKAGKKGSVRGNFSAFKENAIGDAATKKLRFG